MRKCLMFLAAFFALLHAQKAVGQTQILNKIIDDVRAAYNKQERPIVILDLEGTLLDNRPRHLKILQDFAQTDIKVARPQAAQQLMALTVPLIQYRLTDTLANAGVTEEAVVNNAAVFWSEKFFSDDYLKYDAPVPGAVAYVRTLYTSGARIVYVTGRDSPRQLIGTIKSLRDNGFPIGIMGSELIMKPSADVQDPIFKQQVTAYLRHYGKVIASIDSEPANANVYRRAFAESTCVIFNAPRAPNPAPLLPNIVSIASFQ